jgi:hypothetical protein
MMEFDYLVTQELEGRMTTLVDGLAKGAPSDYAEYCKLVGEIRGLRHAMQAVVNARKQANPDDEDIRE